MNGARRLIIVSNRLPYQVVEEGDELLFRQSSGGLVSAITSYAENEETDRFSGKIWMGIPDFSKEKWEKLSDTRQGELDFDLIPVFVPDRIYNSYYNGFANSVIWPLFHYFPSYANYKEENFDAYRRVNEAFADKVAAVAGENDVIWVHDYHLFLLPGLLRKRKPELKIGFFLHTPFPVFEIFRLMPRKWKTDILEGLLGADLIGFHTIEYRRYFLEAVRMVLNVENEFGYIYYGNRVVKADLFPVGIDFEKFRSATEDPTIIELKNKVRKSFKDQKIIFSLDRLDYTKGVMQRLSAFEKFLEMYPDWNQKVVMLLNVIPSRDKLLKYKERKTMIEQKISSINGKFSSYTWQPIVYFYQHLDFNNLASLYQASDVALITPIRDGMNLIAKEYVASKGSDPGVLILSELAGAADELSEALLINPTDVTDMADAIQQALVMPQEEQRFKMTLMQKRLIDYNVNRWVNEFFSELHAVKKLQQERCSVLLSDTVKNKIITDIENAEKRLFFFDYDGTLIPFSKFPSQAEPNAEVLKFLSELADDERNTVVIISGRDSVTLSKWLGSLRIIIVAEHGAMIRYPGQEWQQLAEMRTGWEKNILSVMEIFTRRCNGSFVEEKQFSVAWHYRNVPRQLGFSKSRELIQHLSNILANTPLQVIDGNKVVEVRIANTNKGHVARKIFNELQPDFALVLGDDKTDEDMFRELQNDAVTIKIGMGNTAASYTIPRQKDVDYLLNSLVPLEYK